MRGQISLLHPGGKSGFIRPFDGEHTAVYVNVNDISPPVGTLRLDQVLNFDVKIQVDHPYPRAVNASLESSLSDQDNATQQETRRSDCFVVMPFGKSPGEHEHFLGWYKVVIAPAIHEAGFTPILSATSDQPNAINDEIRSHLASDAMVVVDLGGNSPDSAPNPNVMYELGIRHAFNLPHVIMAWEGQSLPFDIANQRILFSGRRFIDVPQVKEKLAAFIREAAAGNFYRPMDAVGRFAFLSRAVDQLGEKSIIRALIEEVRELRSPASSAPESTKSRTVRQLIGAKKVRSTVQAYFLAGKGSQSDWDKFLATPVYPALVNDRGVTEAINTVALELFGADLVAGRIALESDNNARQPESEPLPNGLQEVNEDSGELPPAAA